ncbi:hypothetical protein F383_27353 [Gossypium arboreum]|uniref:Uncharacterized protein n=1 Tax=Gossypium arboreum TaxID=29729 RepID=A0A0B0PEM4_GOSAR|nr:hypothetical protein F383_27353 [Gossypium arboreum]
MNQSASWSNFLLPILCAPFSPLLGCIYRLWNA